ncbi:hypothetical protein CRENBAI_009435 [Crenichthys baileyi]|uniref:Uncharacterized protein n=1 Tax=Crenichthys baileyi TaxID=28760 RepID=A0AAV9QPZ3_9TELE
MWTPPAGAHQHRDPSAAWNGEALPARCNRAVDPALIQLLRWTSSRWSGSSTARSILSLNLRAAARSGWWRPAGKREQLVAQHKKQEEKTKALMAELKQRKRFIRTQQITACSTNHQQSQGATTYTGSVARVVWTDVTESTKPLSENSSLSPRATARLRLYARTTPSLLHTQVGQGTAHRPVPNRPVEQHHEPIQEVATTRDSGAIYALSREERDKRRHGHVPGDERRMSRSRAFYEGIKITRSEKIMCVVNVWSARWCDQPVLSPQVVIDCRAGGISESSLVI